MMLNHTRASLYRMHCQRGSIQRKVECFSLVSHIWYPPNRTRLDLMAEDREIFFLSNYRVVILVAAFFCNDLKKFVIALKCLRRYSIRWTHYHSRSHTLTSEIAVHLRKDSSAQEYSDHKLARNYSDLWHEPHVCGTFSLLLHYISLQCLGEVVCRVNADFSMSVIPEAHHRYCLWHGSLCVAF